MRLSERPYKNIEGKDFAPDTIEEINRHFDSNFRTLDDRRVAQQTVVSHASGASDSVKIANLTTALNSLLAVLNASDLTEES